MKSILEIFELHVLFKRKHVNSSSIFLDSACQELNLDHNCYKLDPHCPPEIDMEANDTPATISILVVLLSLAIVSIVLFGILSFYRQKRRRESDGKLNDIYI